VANTSGIFTGTSRYAADFSAWIDRAVNIASLQMMQLQSQRTSLASRQSALQSLDSKVASFQSALATLAGQLGLGSYTVSVSDGATVKATASEGIREGAYQIEVTNLGANALAVSKAPGGTISRVQDPSTQTLSTNGPFRLYLDGAADPILISPAEPTLNSLVEAINSQEPDLQATIVNLGGAGGPDYRLSIQHRKLGPHSLSLKDASDAELLDQTVEGAFGTYKVNNGGEIQTETSTVRLAPGLNVEFLKQSSPGAAVSISVTRSASGVSNALRGLVAAYNAVMEELNPHRGQAGGALSGDLAVNDVQDAMRRIASYSTGTQGIDSLTALGIELNDKGVMSFRQDQFEAAVHDNFEALAEFLGTQTGAGFLKWATDLLNSLQNPTSGILKTHLDSLSQQLSAQDQRISAEQERIDQYRIALQERMYAADALIAALEQQVTYFTTMFEAMRVAQRNL